MSRFLKAVAVLAAYCLCAVGSLVTPSTAGAESFAIRLRVEPIHLKKKGTTKLTAIVIPAKTCTRRAVLFQVKDGHGWEKLGKKIEVGDSCHVSQKVKVEQQSAFRALLLDPKKPTTLVTSPSVTVKLGQPSQ